MLVYVGLGSNQGDRREHLQQAVQALALHPGLVLEACSSLYETDYVGPGQQEPYLNAVVKLETGYDPGRLLALFQECEALRGRRPAGHMLPRPLDLDILLIPGRIIRETNLEVPHPRARERAFVLEPLNELGPDEIFPDSRETVARICAKIRQKSGEPLRPVGELEFPLVGSSASKEDWRAALAVYRR